MEYADDNEVIDVMKEKHGFSLVNISTGEACTEFLFARTEATSKATV
jgi:2-polyprenyl-6-hydroxyphenyl methylase/3-demethylubiquinone-9 3-methyltransferase